MPSPPIKTLSKPSTTQINNRSSTQRSPVQLLSGTSTSNTNTPRKPLLKTITPQKVQKITPMKPLAKPDAPSIRTPPSRLAQKKSDQFDKELATAKEMEKDLVRIQKCATDLTKGLQETNENLSQYTDELKDLTLKLHIQNNRLLALNSPILTERIENITMKYSHLWDSEQMRD
jgi:hypothetical protein